MTPKQKAYKKRLIKLAHTLKNSHHVFCDDDARRDILEERYGVRSFKDLTIEELEEVVAMLRGVEVQEAQTGIKATKKQVRCIKILWQRHAREKQAASLLRWIGRTIGITPIRVEFLTRTQASAVITGLCRMFEVEM